VKLADVADRPRRGSRAASSSASPSRARRGKPQVLLFDERCRTSTHGLRLEMRNELRRIQRQIGSARSTSPRPGEALAVSDWIM